MNADTKIRVLLDTDDLNISFTPGQAGTNAALLIFAGIGRDPEGPQRPEFVRNLQLISITHDIYYIADKRRSWFNATADAIVDFMTPRLAGKRVFTLGNSMGGFGAILFASLLPGCEAALAFVPQYSIHREVVRSERRWENFTGQIAGWRHITCMPEITSNARMFIFQGADAVLDLSHTRLFDRALTRDMTLFLVKHGTHECAVFLRDLGMLHRIVDAVVNQGATREDMDALLTLGGIPHRTIFRPPPKPEAEAAEAEAAPAAKRRMDYLEAWDALRTPQTSLAAAPVLEVLANTAAFYIARRPGTADTDTAVLIFSSAAENPGLPQRRNFVQHVGEMQADHDTYFIIDKKRAWFNAIAGDILAVVKPLIAGKRVFTLGNSIGGFGAILFSHLIENCEAAIACDPQYSMHREVIRKERRWGRFLTEIRNWQYLTCMPEPFADRKVIVLQSGTKDSDSLHANNFIENIAPGMAIFALTACEHDACAYLQEHKVLRPILDHVVYHEAEADDVAALLSGAGIAFKKHISPLATASRRTRAASKPLPSRRGSPRRRAGSALSVPEVVS